MWSGEEDPDTRIFGPNVGSACKERNLRPFYDFALRRIDIESKEGILCNLWFLLNDD
jgi:hypothetical protein